MYVPINICIALKFNYIQTNLKNRHMMKRPVMIRSILWTVVSD